jgi:hypothetical protein
MNPPNRKSSLTRRQFLGRLSLVAGAAPAFHALPAAARGERASSAVVASNTPATPVVSFHVDQPYLDKTGTALPYVPPRGARAGQAVSELSEVEYLSRYMYL